MTRSIIASALLYSLSACASEGTLATALSNDMVQAAHIATLTNQNIDYQPFILSVWEHRDLVAFGAYTLKDAILLVPGIEMTGDTINNRTPIIRGSNPFAYGQTKLLIDGILVNDQSFDSYNAYLDFPIDLIKRIEVVRGSGSFIEGVNGYSGTINVITFAHDAVSGSDRGSVFAGAGSNDARQAGIYRRFDVAGGKFAVDAFTQRDNARSPVTVSDRFGKPGSAPLQMKQNGGGLSYYNDAFYLKGRVNDYMHGSAFGNLYALPNPEGVQKTPSLNLEAGYRFRPYRDAELLINGGYSEDSWASDARSLPAGPFFKEGYWAFLELKNRRSYGGISGIYTGLKDHTLSAGYTYKDEGTYNLRSVTTNRLTGGPDLVDYSLTAPFLNAPSAQRISHKYSLEDQIAISPEIALALNAGGVRTSDIGNAHYLRGALVYQPQRRHIFKLMVGNSYRLPSWQEMYTANNPSRIGNPDLKPEHVVSYEAQYLYKPTVSTTAGINLFYLRNKEQIALDSHFTYQNMGSRDILGVESEIRGSFGEKNLYALSYSYLNGETIKGSETIDYLTHSSTQILKGALSYALTPQLRAGIVGRYENPKKREPNDPRSGATEAFSSIDLNLGWENEEGFYLQGSVKNICNRIYRYPSIVNTYPDDLPVEGRTAYLRGGWKF